MARSHLLKALRPARVTGRRRHRGGRHGSSSAAGSTSTNTGTGTGTSTGTSTHG